LLTFVETIGSSRFNDYASCITYPTPHSVLEIYNFDLQLRSFFLRSLGAVEVFLASRVAFMHKGKNTLSFGIVRNYISELPLPEQQKFALDLNLANPRELHALLRNFVHVRNLCAHHERLWQRNLQYEIPGRLFTELRKLYGISNPYSVAASLMAIQQVNATFGDHHGLLSEFRTIQANSKLTKELIRKNMGFEVP